tara:strand:- start:1195 stop:1329 length:135 start_codon:yes stop_codon:yes gene_type:complete
MIKIVKRLRTIRIIVKRDVKNTAIVLIELNKGALCIDKKRFIQA